MTAPPKDSKYPEQSLCRSLFSYENGLLIWKQGIGGRSKTGKPAGTKTVDGYIAINYKGVRWLAHRVIWIYHNGTIPPNTFIDHINRIRDDNRVENLRLADHSLNAVNTPDIERDLPVGVHLNDYGKGKICKKNPYKATFKRKHLGSFKTPEEANKAYIAARNEYLEPS